MRPGARDAAHYVRKRGSGVDLVGNRRFLGHLSTYVRYPCRVEPESFDHRVVNLDSHWVVRQLKGALGGGVSGFAAQFCRAQTALFAER